MTVVRKVRFQLGFYRDLDDRAKWLKRNVGSRASRAFVERVVARCYSLRIGGLRGRRRDELMPGARVIAIGRSANLYFYIDAEQILIIGLFGSGLSDEKLKALLRARGGAGEI